MTRNEVKEKIIALVADQLGVAADTVNEQATLESLGADSLDRVEMIMKLEEEFRIEVPHDAENLSSVVEWIDYVYGLKK